MNKEETIKFLQDDRKELEAVLENLLPEDYVTFRVLGTWKIKDVIAHLSGWNIELKKSIDKLLKNEELWFVTEDEGFFNKIQVMKRKSLSVEQVLDEWKRTFIDLIERIKNLTDEEWEFTSIHNWKSGAQITIKSLFSYRKKGKGHEGYHASLIEEYFDRDYCDCEIY
ncbi:MAG: DinB family protein [Candidatus Heimdallarchaeaceae archaeon]